jgi:hypothetical protein
MLGLGRQYMVTSALSEGHDFSSIPPFSYYFIHVPFICDMLEVYYIYYHNVSNKYHVIIVIRQISCNNSHMMIIM